MGMAAATPPVPLLPSPSPSPSPSPTSSLLLFRPLPRISSSSSISLSTPSFSIATNSNFFPNQKPHRRNSLLWRTFALEDAAPPPPSAEIVAPAQEIVSTDDGVGTIISTLLFIAFLALSVLTVGVIYIAVTDFLQKREKEKFEKEEAAKKKRGGRGKKAKPRARAGPRGFGQKVDTEDDDYSANED